MDADFYEVFGLFADILDLVLGACHDFLMVLAIKLGCDRVMFD